MTIPLVADEIGIDWYKPLEVNTNAPASSKFRTSCFAILDLMTRCPRMDSTPSIDIEIRRDVGGKRTQSTNINQLNFHQVRKYLDIKHWNRISLRLIPLLSLILSLPILDLSGKHALAAEKETLGV